MGTAPNAEDLLTVAEDAKAQVSKNLPHNVNLRKCWRPKMQVPESHSSKKQEGDIRPGVSHAGKPPGSQED